MPVDMFPVTSHIATDVGYDPETQELHYKHHNGRTTVFRQVPPHVGEAAISADSIGRFYHSNIKNQYRGEPL